MKVSSQPSFPELLPTQHTQSSLGSYPLLMSQWFVREWIYVVALNDTSDLMTLPDYAEYIGMALFSVL